MGYWSGGYVQDLLIIVALLALAAGIRRRFEPLQRLGMPDALIAGGFGLLLGPTVLGLLPFSAERLELFIYHALALVFIAVSLQAPPPSKGSKTARSISFAIPLVATLQGVLGLACVLGWNALAGAPALHSGLAMMLPLGFNQGPGPAMSLGDAWDRDAGMSSGAQIGLIMAALGYAWCCLAGVVLVAWGRRRGWHRTPGRGESAAEAEAVTAVDRPAPRRATLGALEPLTAQVVAIAVVYLATWLVLELLGPRLPEQHQSTLWGFHFLIATGLALAVRPVAVRLPGGNPLDDDLLARISSVLVDVATCAALAAVSVLVLGEHLLPILLISTVGGLTTLLVVVWVARRAFPTAPFGHAVVTFGSLTGTATTGMALLRMLDPELSGPAARNYVRAIPLAVVLGLPLFILMPIAVLGFPASYPGKPLLVLGVLCGYALILLLAWRLLAPLRFGKARSWWRLWPEDL
jgi:glutamate:Na+ symporter, ESS family